MSPSHPLRKIISDQIPNISLIGEFFPTKELSSGLLFAYVTKISIQKKNDVDFEEIKWHDIVFFYLLS